MFICIDDWHIIASVQRRGIPANDEMAQNKIKIKMIAMRCDVDD